MSRSWVSLCWGTKARLEQGRFARFGEKPGSPCDLKSPLVSLCLDTKARLLQALLARLVEQPLTVAVAAAIVEAAPGMLILCGLQHVCNKFVVSHNPANNLMG